MSGGKQEKRSWFDRVLGRGKTPVVVQTEEEPPPLQELGVVADLRKTLTAWQAEFAKGVPEGQDVAAGKRLDLLEQALVDWLLENPVRDANSQKECDELQEQLQVSRVRITISRRPATEKSLPPPPLLAWKWCEKHLDKGQPLSKLKTSLPAFETSVAQLNKAPSPTALNEAVSKLSTVSDTVSAGQDHYQKPTNGGPDSPMGRAWAQLGVLAQRQSDVLKALGVGMADFDPVEAGTAAKNVVVNDRVNRMTHVTTERDEGIKDAQRIFDTEREAALDQKRQQDTEARDVLQDAILIAANDPIAQEEARQQCETALQDNKNRFDQTEKRLLVDLERHKGMFNEAFDRTSNLAELKWTACRTQVPPRTSLYKALADALPAYEEARTAFEKTPTAATHQAALDKLWTLQKDVNKAVAKSSAEGRKLPGSDRPRLMRAGEALMQRIAHEAGLLQRAESELPQSRMARAVMTSDPSGHTLDAWVAELGGQAKTPADKARVRAALKAKYGLDALEGDMSTKALPRLFDVLGRVPLAQTGGNDSLKKVVRSRSDFSPSGFYEGGKKLMQLNVGRIGRTGLSKALFGTALPFVEKPPGGWEGSDLKKPKTIDVFDHLTLHEIGHSVDDKLGFMAKRMGNSAYGGWKKSSSTEVRNLALGALGFGDAFPRLSKEFKERYLDRLLEKQDPSQDPPKDVKVDWVAMGNHAGARFCKAARLGDGTVTEVTQWDKKAKDAEHGGRVYQQSYPGSEEWYSYEVAVRSRGIGGYQFRAPGEWFAEIYACYYGGRLKSSHPDYVWMQALVDTDA